MALGGLLTAGLCEVNVVFCDAERLGLAGRRRELLLKIEALQHRSNIGRGV